MMSEIDHLVVTAPSLEAGAAFIRQTLGVAPETGGEHPGIGTHNLLLRLGPALYLEVIAPNPAAPRPERPRWFNLDRLRPDSAPALSAWVARTGDIGASVARASEPLGTTQPMRRGSLAWLIAVPGDGTVPLDGVGPALIEWQTRVHPAASLPDRGLSLVALEIVHPEPARLAHLFASIALEGPLVVSPPSPGEAPHLIADIATPSGRHRLTGRGQP